MVALSILTTFICPEKMDFLMNSVRSLAPESASSLSNLAFSSAFRRQLYLRSAGSLLGFLPVLVLVVFSIHMGFLVYTFFSFQNPRLWSGFPGFSRASWFLSDKRLFVGQGHNLLCSLEQRILLWSDCCATLAACCGPAKSVPIHCLIPILQN